MLLLLVGLLDVLGNYCFIEMMTKGTQWYQIEGKVHRQNMLQLKFLQQKNNIHYCYLKYLLGQFEDIYIFFNRPGVAGAVLQSPPSLIN